MKFLAHTTSTCSASHMLELNLLGLALVFVTPMLGGFLYGFDIGATSFVLSMLLSDDSGGDDVWWNTFGSVQQGLFVSAMSLGALCGSHLVLMHLSNKIGRRMEIRLCSIFYLVGTFFNVLSGTVFRSVSFGFYLLFLGRLIYGMGVGFIMHGAAAYIAEMCPPQIRGAVVSAKETVIVGGIVGGYAIGNSIAQADNNGHWTTLYAMSGLSALPMLVLTYFIPRSKRWLLMKGYRQEAYESMAFVYKGDIQEEFDHLEAKIETNPQHSFYEDDDATPSLCDPKYRSAMIASMGLIIFQQFSGQPSVLSYATVLFQAAGWSGNASVVSSVLMMCMSISTVLLVDRVGRKRLLMVCCIIMMTALSALSTSFWGWNGTAELGTAQKCIILVAMFVYIGGYQVGFGPITWCIVSEVFPLEIRGKAIALGVELNYGLNFLVQFTFPILKEKLGWGPTFCFFGVILAFCLFFVKTCVPETTGLTLEEIQLKLSMRETFPSERSSLLPDFMGGGLHNLEEMENQMIRTHSEIALAEKENPNKPK